MRELADFELDLVSGGFPMVNGQRVWPPGPGCWTWNQSAEMWVPCTA